jgi:16S rRNA (uracil1498-N3)-methyltransferase
MDLIENCENWRYPRFFVGANCVRPNEMIEITGDDLHHATKVLRMKAGDKAIFCDGAGTDYLCVYAGAGKFEVLEKFANSAEPQIHLRLFQCAPKGDKLDFIVQKAVELGVSEIIPMVSKRCVSRPKPAAAMNKTARLQKIALEAAKQCGRGKVPRVHEFADFNSALELYKSGNLGIIFYECGGKKLGEIIKKTKNIDIFIGSEGGFEAAEIEAARERGIIPATLGKRILRVETAPISAISILMNLIGEM